MMVFMGANENVGIRMRLVLGMMVMIDAIAGSKWSLTELEKEESANTLRDFLEHRMA